MIGGRMKSLEMGETKAAMGFAHRGN